MKLLGLTESIDLLAELEQRFPVNEWTADGLRIWPLVRYQLSFRTTAFPAAPPGGRLRRLARGAALAWDAVSAPLRDARGNLPAAAPADAFFLSYSFARQALLDGRHVDVFCGPLMDELRAMGLRVHAWEYSHAERHRLPRASPSYLAQRKLLASYARSRFRRAELRLPGYADFRSFLESKDAFPAEIAEERLAARAAAVLSLRRTFAGALEAIRPRIAFTANLSTYEFAFLAACRGLGIPSVEIQHGVQGPAHGLYSRWTAVPREGYDLLPDGYWSWDDESARTINAWSRSCAPRHRAVAGGIPWVQYCRSLDPSRLEARHRALLAPAPGRRILLVTLQPPEVIYADGAALPGILLDAMRASPPEWSWWIRLHPMMERDYGRIRRLLREVPATVELEGPSELPLYAVLAKADLHLTHSSSVVLDGAGFGICSIVWSDYGAEAFGKSIEAGTCVKALSGASIAEAARRFLAAGRPPPSTPPVPLRRTLDSWLERTGRAP